MKNKEPDTKTSKSNDPVLEDENTVYDLFIIGGGINGCGIARDAAGRGYSTYLCEADDLASGTSSQSTKLVHGGLRYLEHYEFKLVREALTEREVLWKIAPHIIHPLRFVLPFHKGLRPWWLLRIGLFIYDHLGGRKKLPVSHSLSLIDNDEGNCLKQNFEKGLEYSDCWVNDSRLVVLNAIDACDKGAIIKTQHKCIGIERYSDVWKITVENQINKTQETVQAKALINATGPWVDDMINISQPNQSPAKNIRKVQGSHIVVPKLYDHDKCYIFQNEDDRIIFAIPYHQDYTYLGTTDYEIEGDPRDAKITDEEIAYLCNAANEYFKTEINPKNVVSTYAGVRALYNDGASKAQEATRDYVLRVDEESENKAPFIHIFGGKITTYRKLAESMMEIIDDLFNKDHQHWTENTHLPGGDFAIDDRQQLLDQYIKNYAFLEEKTVIRLFNAYGTHITLILEGANEISDLGLHFGHGLYQKEVEYLIEHEFAYYVDDLLLRRSKLGLVFNAEQKETLKHWLNFNKKDLTSII